METSEASLPISDTTWKGLTKANDEAVRNGWAESGVFATGVGPEYRRGHRGSLLYVGKSAGPLSTLVGSCHDQQASARASLQWMIERRNTSAFWQFVDRIDASRRSFAWTNICKIDRKGGKKKPPPNETHFAQVAKPCIAALEEEMVALMPHVTVFATSDAYKYAVLGLLERLSYKACPPQIKDGLTTCFRTSEGRFVIMTRHPQGWCSSERDRIIDLTKIFMSGG